jgi:hypothetical protein
MDPLAAIYLRECANRIAGTLAGQRGLMHARVTAPSAAEELELWDVPPGWGTFYKLGTARRCPGGCQHHLTRLQG